MYRVSSLSAEDNSVTVTLQCTTGASFNTSIRCPTRQLKLPSDGSVLTIGRASKNAIKNLQPTPSNAFFDCAVMSRTHAEIYLADGRHVMLKDTGSLHGTSVNDKKVEKDVVLRSGDLIKFGDSVSRMESIHDGIKVRVNIDRPAVLSQPTQTATMRTNTFRVPSDDEDDQVKETSLEDDTEEKNIEHDDVTPSDDDDERILVTSVTRIIPPRNKHVSDDSHANSGLSRYDPVVMKDVDKDLAIDEELDEELVALAYSSSDSSPNSPTVRRSRIAQEIDFPDFDDSDYESENEYGSDAEDSRSMPSGSASPQPQADAEVSADDTSSDEESEAEYIPEKVVEAEVVGVLEPQPEPKEPIIAPSQPEAVAPKMSSFFPFDRTLPNPEIFKSGSTTTVSTSTPVRIMQPFGKIPAISGGNTDYTVNQPSSHHTFWDSYLPARQPEYEPIGYNGSFNYYGDRGMAASSHGHPVKADSIEYPYPFASCMPISVSVHESSVIECAKDKRTMADGIEAQVQVPEASQAEQTQQTDEVDPAATIATDKVGGGRKRKRGDDVDGTEDIIGWDSEWDEDQQMMAKEVEALISGRAGPTGDEARDINELSVKANNKERHDSGSEMTDEQAMGTRKWLKMSVRSQGPAKKSKEVYETRPAKRARSSSVSFALTAAAGAVGGCVATVSFLWSPLAERLLT